MKKGVKTKMVDFWWKRGELNLRGRDDHYLRRYLKISMLEFTNGSHLLDTVDVP